MDPFETKNTYCPRNKPKYHSLFINCGGEETTVLGNIYDQDNDTSLSYTSPKKNWAYSLSGDWLVPKSNTSDYIKSTTRGVSITVAPMYKKARLSPRQGGKWRKTNNCKSFSYKVVQDSDRLEIHLHWPGKGSYYSALNFNGPLISTISVNPEIKIGHDEFTVKELIKATEICSEKNKIDGSRTVFMDELSSTATRMSTSTFCSKREKEEKEEIGSVESIGGGEIEEEDPVDKPDDPMNKNQKTKLDSSHTVAVKRLDSGHFKEKIDELKKEIHFIQSLQHNNILQLLDVHIEKDLRFLVYEYMENKSLADILFVPSRVKLEWETSNILLNKNFEAKISDFGFARLYTEEDKVRVIASETKNYLQRLHSARVFAKGRFNVDVFSFGVVVLEIVSGERNVVSSSKKEVDILLERAYRERKGRNLKSLVDKSLRTFDERKAIDILKLAVECTVLGTSVRPTMSDVVGVLVGEISIDKVCPPAEPTGDVNVASSTTPGKSTSLASTSSYST
ncbi:hypothetical protein C1H46_027748 [Malus baccata]|uniref:Protein kinase domain-containing protein n=1 Tax=Malus baccata TaxID=106549 RepID=A0A540LJS5_MALBA|nr:hypothetical protein C1H46_027748 [Malus baccata]